MRLGIDFGSTYSTISRYDSVSDRVEALTLVEGESASIPSVVSISKKKGEIACGNSAKNKIGRDSYHVFEAFKMLLVEINPDKVAEKGYTEKYSPRYITKCFLEYLLKGVINRYGNGDDTIEELVVCVPEVWSSHVKTLDGRNILREIIQNDIQLPGTWTIENIRIVTEPEAASAFFAHNYERERKTSFNGHLLLIDYGGGTLDVTLTEVLSDGDRSMEIGYRESGGVGENHPDAAGNYIVGNAAIAYMQQVTALAIGQSGILEDGEEPDFTSNDFKSAFHELEDALKDSAHINSIEYYFGMLGDYSDFDQILEDESEDDEDESEVFCYIEYQDEEIPVKYRHLYLAYRDTIEGVLKQELDTINQKVREQIGADPCTIESGMRDDFKIALVGGFGSFYLVKKQIAAMYHFDSNEQNDLRLKNINSDKSEQAIALGAGLLASGRVVLQKTARFSIGLSSESSAKVNKKHIYYGIRFHQQVDPGQPYFMLRGNAVEDAVDNRIVYGGLKNNITHFVVQFSQALDRGFPMAIKNEFRRKLDDLPEEGVWNCGFSMDENDIISFHIVPVRGLETVFKETIIPLDNYTNLFDLTAGEEVFADEV